ncbi:hypothetical protein HPB48_006810 [Haemaphysalis longicornis]|uniref:Uncharacterized protein n=1 Tax=Haemaphysalis longicornis TaxID=44386 RepID=A0A9J6FFY0_HAELO|nr:hypothetical protein HPB48_006810 [Haemaphysalis longicornis]
MADSPFPANKKHREPTLIHYRGIRAKTHNEATRAANQAWHKATTVHHTTGKARAPCTCASSSAADGDRRSRELPAAASAAGAATPAGGQPRSLPPRPLGLAPNPGTLAKLRISRLLWQASENTQKRRSLSLSFFFNVWRLYVRSQLAGASLEAGSLAGLSHTATGQSKNGVVPSAYGCSRCSNCISFLQDNVIRA